MDENGLNITEIGLKLEATHTHKAPVRPITVHPHRPKYDAQIRAQNKMNDLLIFRYFYSSQEYKNAVEAAFHHLLPIHLQSTYST